MLCNSGQHSRTDFLIVVEGEDYVRVVSLGQGAMGAGLALTVQPQRSKAARMRRAFVAGQLLTRRGRSR